MPFSDAQWRVWQNRMRQTVSEGRYRHCLRVAVAAADLARHHGLDVDLARQAGLLHDVARDMPLDELVNRAKDYRIHVGKEELANPIILHAPVGAAILAREWQVKDENMLQAVELHTVAMPGMDKFCQVLYLADLIEPGRKRWPELNLLLALCYKDLDSGMAAALKGNLRYLQSRGTFVHPRAVEAYDFFRVQE